MKSLLLIMIMLGLSLSCRSRTNQSGLNESLAKHSDVLKKLGGIYLVKEPYDKVPVENILGQAFEINLQPLEESELHFPLQVDGELEKRMQMQKNAGQLFAIYRYFGRRSNSRLIYLDDATGQDRANWDIGKAEDGLVEESLVEVLDSGIKHTETVSSKEGTKGQRVRIWQAILQDDGNVKIDYGMHYHGQMDKLLGRSGRPEDRLEGDWSVLYQRVKDLPQSLKPSKIPPPPPID